MTAATETWDPLLSDPDTEESLGFLLAEEAALKAYLSGHTVPGKRGAPTQVRTWFRWPDSRTNISYPYILIDLLTISPDFPRWTSVWDYGAMGSTFESYVDSETREGYYSPSMNGNVVPTSTSNLTTENYLAYKLFFQITITSREVQHDRYLTARAITDFFPARNFFVGVPADSTWRRCELVEWVSADTQETTEATKRIFRKIYTVSMEAEIPQSAIEEIIKIRKLHVDVYDTATVDTSGNVMKEPVGHQASDAHTVAAINYTEFTPSGS